MTPFHQFLSGLKADVRLGRYLPAPLESQTPETIVLSLCIALADATDGHRTHPAFKTLEELDAMECGR